jgi:hypothetical protein
MWQIFGSQKLLSVSSTNIIIFREKYIGIEKVNKQA